MKAAMKRIINIDIKNIQNSDLNEQGIYIKFNEEDMMKAVALIIGPKDSLYEHGFLIFDIQFPNNYPFSPPKFTYKSVNKVRIHPNIYVNGKVCLSILGTWAGPSWTSAMDIVNVLITIQSLLDSNPLTNEPGYENVLDSPKGKKVNDNYNEIIQYNTYNSLLYKNIKYRNDTLFKNEIEEYYSKYKQAIISKIEKHTHNVRKTHNCIYGINEIIDYTLLYNNFKDLCIEL